MFLGVRAQKLKGSERDSNISAPKSLIILEVYNQTSRAPTLL